MLDYLGIPYRGHTSLVAMNGWDDVQRMLLKTLEEEKNYYRSTYQFLPDNHLLVNLVDSYPVSIHQDDLDYYTDVSMDALYHCAKYGIASSVHRGKVHQGWYYGKDKELWVSSSFCISQYSSIHSLFTDWENLVSVRVLRHCYRNVDFQIGIMVDDYTGYIHVLEIDPVALMIQYKKWREVDGNENKDTKEFIFRYPLTNSIKSHVDLCILNGFIGTSYIDRPYHQRTTAPVINQRMIDRCMESAIRSIKKQRWDIAKILSGMPTIDGSRWKDLWIFPDTILNRQNTWVYLYAILPVLNYICSIEGAVNTVSRNNLNSNIDRFRSSNVLNDVTLRSIKHDYRREINQLSDTINRK